jgi:site-specific recombinase XerD
MTTSAHFRNEKSLRRIHEGPLGIYVDQYAARMTVDGYGRQSGWYCLGLVSDFSRWLLRTQRGVRDVDEQAVVHYLTDRARDRRPGKADRSALKRLLTVLREAGAIGPSASATLNPHEQIFADFVEFLDRDRGLTRVTIIHHRPVIRLFLKETGIERAEDFAKLGHADIIGFVERHARDHGPDTAKGLCWSLRAFLRYLRYEDRILVDLAGCVPTIRRWKYASLPTCLSASQVRQVLDACDRRTALGIRDYAILMMLARLGLRANEVATLLLDDMNWRSSEVLIHAKGRQQARMPLPPEVGAAIATYLRESRPRSASRRLFLRENAPYVGFASSAAVSMIAKMALKRAGMNGFAHMGAHLLRHSLATELLQSGATLTEIGQVLRHRDHDTTRIYAKVDIDALRNLSPAWPGDEQ